MRTTAGSRQRLSKQRSADWLRIAGAAVNTRDVLRTRIAPDLSAIIGIVGDGDVATRLRRVQELAAGEADRLRTALKR